MAGPGFAVHGVIRASKAAGSLAAFQLMMTTLTPTRRKLRTCRSERSEESKDLVRNHDATRLTGPSLGALRF